MDWPTILDEVRLQPAEHQVFLSFINDEDAVSFREWWEAEGFKEFEKWDKHQRYEKFVKDTYYDT